MYLLIPRGRLSWTVIVLRESIMLIAWLRLPSYMGARDQKSEAIIRN